MCIKDKLLTYTKQQHDKEIKTMQCQLDREHTLQSRFDGYAPGRGKWKKIGLELFNMKVLKDHLIDATCTHIKEKLYNKTSWAYNVDMFRGLNLTGIDNGRNIELSRNGRRLIWGSGSVKGIHRQIEKDMHEEIYFEVIKYQDGESVIDGINFDMISLFAYLVKAFRLEEEAKIRNVEISITVDGAELDPNTHHVTIGFKICDKMARDPASGKFLFLNEEGVSDAQQLDNTQFGAWYFPLLGVVAKDNTQTYDKYLRHVFEFGKDLRHHGFDDNDEGWLPFNVSEPQDMKSNWLCLQRGGAAKGPGVLHFCHLCHCRSDDISLPNLLTCGKCIGKGKIRCDHLNLIDDYDIAHAKEELARLDRCPIASIFGCACALQTGGCQDYYKLYQQCKLHIVKTGRQAGIDDDIDQHKLIYPYEYDLLLKETLDLFGVLESVHKKQPKDMKKLARVLLTCLDL
jgi:hypothetical protein